MSSSKEFHILRIMKEERCNWPEAEKKYQERKKIQEFF